MIKKIVDKFRNIISHEIRLALMADRQIRNEYERKVLNKIRQYEYREEWLKRSCLQSAESGISSQMYSNCEVIVSLTTYGKRFYEVYLAIESIMQGTLKPNRIILWLQDDMKAEPLPVYLKNQVKRGLQIEYCEDLLSYKKLIPALQHYPDACIVTIDDDVLYEYDMLEKLLASWQKEPKCIHAGRVHRILLDNNQKPLSYLKWKNIIGSETPSCLNFFTGVGGVLYPPHSLSPEVLNKDVFMDICKHADDVWFYAMALKNGYMVKKVYTHDPEGEDYLMNHTLQGESLSSKNNNSEHCENDKQIEAVFSKYDIYRLLKENAS